MASFKGLWNWTKQAAKAANGERVSSIMLSNQAIQKGATNQLGLLDRMLASTGTKTANITAGGTSDGMFQALATEAEKKAGVANLGWGRRQKALRMNADGTMNYGKVAADAGVGVVGLSAAGRIAGSTIYDSNGNFNVIGIPIV